MPRKVILGVLAAVFIAGLTFLAVNGSKTLATTDNGKITQADYVDELKQSSAGRQVFAQMVINKVLDKKYGKQVTDSEIDKSFNNMKSQYGEEKFKSYLSQNGMTTKQFKQNLRDKQVMQLAVKANYKPTRDQLNQAYEEYVPDTKVSLITTDNEDDAQAAIDALNDGAEWDDVFHQYSKQNAAVSGTGQLPAFDSTNTTIEQEVRMAGFNQGEGAYSETPVKGSKGNYYVVRMDHMDEKPAQEKVESKLKDKLTNDFINDSKNQDEMKKIIGKLLSAADVKVKDSDLKGALSGYMKAAV
ncbi:peptidylprolyl isomerase [Fructobacillus sp. W13]|uniref:Foldase protein PrsA n=1 Tax=Fructobacillus apis TaxID=2935017 RepID=A0ABT0ZNM5_9LACO|nr:SurA N-terminal domain-containing protein [Fructobacillus apis]MCO0831594.1 peptidylprolyl isomerase [Fructobacillus apis]